jgi:hypothetical protein
MTKKYSVGIDPSFSTMGVCIYDLEGKKIVGMKTGEFFECVRFINETVKLAECVAVVENPALDKTTFGMWGLLQKEIIGYNKKVGKVYGASGSMAEIQSVFSICMNHAQKVGENKAAAKLIISMLREKGVDVLEIAPSERDKAYSTKRGGSGEKVLKDVRLLTMPTKTTAEQFDALTGYKARSSEHARDAATLVWGKTLNWIEMNIQIKEGVEKKPNSYPKTENHNLFIINRKGEKNHALE